MTSRGLLAGSLLAISAVLSWWLLEQASKVAGEPEQQVKRRVDYYFEDFSMSAMDENGQPRHRLRSPHLSFYPNESLSEITLPVITLYNENGPAWVVESERGTVSTDGKKLDLLGEVTMTQSADDSEDPFTILTRDLHILPDNEILETSESVTITNQHLTMQGDGMHADLGEGKLKLVSNVKARHVLD